MKASFPAALALAAMMMIAPACRAALSPEDHADITHVEDYLNAVTVLRAHFLQIAPNGDSSEGTLSLSRPGHLRLDYDPPSPIMIIANSEWLIFFDKQLGQPSYVDIDSSPAGLLIKPHLKLEGDGLSVTEVTRRPGVLEVGVVKQADPRQGKITLIFSENPFQLRQWHVVDAQGQMTSVSLFDPHLDAKFDKGFFDFKDPKAQELPNN